MKVYDLASLAQAMGAELRGDGSRRIAAVSTDTRRLEPGALFFALSGENFDAHDFLSQAAESGAGALVVSRKVAVPEGLPVLMVDDVLAALQRLAAWYRRELDLPVVAITGSNGKTSTKDLVRAVLGRRFRVNATRGNLNNHIGLPLSILATEEADEVLVLEMGMNHAGELAPLCEIARPDIGIITNVGTAHIEHLGSREAIAEEKGTLARALGSEGTLVVLAEGEFTPKFRAETAARVLAAGGEELRAEGLEFTPEGSRFELVIEGMGSEEVTLPVTGRHMVGNALLAAGAGLVAGLDLEEIATGLASLELTTGRLRRFEQGGVTVLDDTYNANPDSVAAAIETLADLPTGDGARKWVVLGMMAELGAHAAEAHVAVGRLARERGLRVVAVGEAARGIAEGAGEGAEFFAEREKAVAFLRGAVAAGDVVLFKGSRMAAMERVMNELFSED
ncbi:MAG: UDP-N-acetylmuramoyl-tripeptide--D-alanyl-D-alanine ligase [Verrucomicrobiales bacterium]